MRRIAESLAKLRDWFVPLEHSKSDIEATRRARMVVSVSATVVFFGPAYVAIFWYFDSPLMVVAAALTTLALLATPFVLRQTGSVVLAGNMLSLSLFAVVSLYSFVMGGLQAPGTLWHCAFPIVGFALASFRSGVFWTTAAMVEIVALFFAERAGLLSSPLDLSEDSLKWIGLSSDLGLVLLVLVFTLAFESQKNAALERFGAANRELEKANREAREASRAKSEFLANMSHEIRTPMNGVLGMARRLTQADLEPEDKRVAGIIRRSAQALLAILDDVLDLSKVEAGQLALEKSPTDPCDLITDTVELLGEAARDKGIELTTRIEQDACRLVDTDPVRLRQVLVNLVSNAVKFTEVGGVEIRLIDLQPSDPGSAPRLRFEIADTGIGIAPEHQESVFDVFTQADASTTRRFGGTGLGLAICARLVELMGGDIGLESTAGAGSTFWFEIPAEESSSAAIDARDSSGITLGPNRVLVADDDPINQEVTVAMLREIGCVVDTAADGREAIAALRPHEHSLVLMDCQMPDVDGYGATRAIRDAERLDPSRPRMPIIALTASALKEDRIACLESGMDDHLAKPFTIRQLHDILETWSISGQSMVSESSSETGSETGPASRSEARPARASDAPLSSTS